MIKNLIFALLVLFTFSTCTKRTETKIIGSWDVEDVGQETFPKDGAWTFFADGKLVITNDINGNPVGSVTGNWDAFSRTAVIPYIEIKGLGPKGMDGKWRVETLNSRILIINRVEFGNGETAGSFLRREFTKK